MKTSKYILGIGLLACLAVGCQDEWNDHYGQTTDSEYGNASLYEIMSGNQDLSDFCQVLKAAKIFANSRQTDVTYAELLNGDQFFTVWAPVNGTFNRDSLIEMCKTSEGDSLVELHFVRNHIARYSHSLNGEESNILMMNGKRMNQNATSIQEVSLAKANLSARNGVLHTLQTPIDYYYNIYEALVALPEYDHIGKFLRSYQIDRFIEGASLPKSINSDGKTEYVDSVFRSDNDLLNYEYDYIDGEDSTFWMIVPTRELWDSLYAEAETYFNYRTNAEKRDSIHERNSYYALMQDLIFNPRRQTSIQDSITSISWFSSVIGRFHTYWNPFASGGLFDPNKQWAKVQNCSNGIIYQVNQWPFKKDSTYFKRINVEAEGRIYKFDEDVAGKKLSVETKPAYGDSVSNSAYLVVTPATQTDKYYVEYELPGVLSGDYDVCIVFLPRNVNSELPFTDDDVAGKRNRRAAKFTATLTYAGLDGKECKVESKYRYKIDPTNPEYYVKGGNTDKSIPFLFNCNYKEDNYATRAFTNNPFAIDTVKLCTFHFPTCNFDEITCTNRLRITNAIGSTETNSFWGVWFIDRILLIPHIAEN